MLSPVGPTAGRNFSGCPLGVATRSTVGHLPDEEGQPVDLVTARPCRSSIDRGLRRHRNGRLQLSEM